MTCRGCCSYPNGYTTIAVGLLSVVAFILTSISLWTCGYAEIDATGTGVGLMYREVTDFDIWYSAPTFDGYECTVYGAYASYDQFTLLDSTFRASQGLGLTAWMVGAILSLAIWSVAPCVASTRIGWRIIGGLLLLIGFCQLFTLLLLVSNVCGNGCSLKSGGIVSIVAWLVWWLAAALCFKIPEPRDEDQQFTPPHSHAVATATPVQLEIPTVAQQQQQQQPTMVQETTTQRVEDDGTTIIETIKTNPDGTITQTTSIIPPAAATTSATPLPPDAGFKTT